ncbi:hypothetical protein ACFLXC_06515 [Chloroflexota bacterium]
MVRRAEVDYDPSSAFNTIPLFDEKVYVHPEDRIILGNSPSADYIINDLGYTSKLSILWYLVGVKDLPVSGE